MMVPVDRGRLYEVAIPLREPFVISGGTLATRRSLIVALEDDRGNVGYGEAAPFEAPFYSAETVASATSCIRDWLLPRVLGHAIPSADALHALLTEGIRGNEMARAGVETAWWDLCAARSGAPLADLVTRRLAALGVGEPWVHRRPSVECGVALGIPADGDVETLASWTDASIARGYRRIKIKIRPGWDLEPVRTVLRVLDDWGEDLPVTVDANGAYHPERDAELLEALDELGLLYIEQPFPPESLWDSVELAHGLATPICLDETLTSLEIGRQVLAMGGPDVWNIKVQRVGGLEEACRLYALGAPAGMRLWSGTMPETGLGAQATLALAGHAGFVFPSDLEPSTRWYAPGADLIELEMDGEGRMPVPEDRRVPDVGRLVLAYDSASP